MREKVWDFMSRVLNASEKVRPLIKESLDMPSNQLKTIINCVDSITGENTATKINLDGFKEKVNANSNPNQQALAQQAEKMNKKLVDKNLIDNLQNEIKQLKEQNRQILSNQGSSVVNQQAVQNNNDTMEDVNRDSNNSEVQEKV